MQRQGSTESAERVVALDGAHNFRDLGGYPTRDGRRLRWGVIYRSGVMADLSDADHDRLHAIGIRLVCDLRANDERSARPTRWRPGSGTEFWSRDHEMSVGKLLQILKRPGASADSLRQFMMEAYRRLPYEQDEAYRQLFLSIAAGKLPLVFHCSAGKDRTGCAAALVMSALDVPRAAIVEDYCLTDSVFDASRRMILADPLGRSLATLPGELWQPVVAADPAYIEAMFGAIEQRHGSVEGYLTGELGLDADTLARVRDQLLEPS